MTGVIPMIDITALLAPRESDTEKWEACANQVGKACKEFGLFYVKSNSTDIAELMNATFEASRCYFERSSEQKKASCSAFAERSNYTAVGKSYIAEDGSADLSERLSLSWRPGVDYSSLTVPTNEWADTPMWGPQEWFADVPGFRQSTNRYWTQVRLIGDAVLRAIAHHLGHSDEHHFAKLDAVKEGERRKHWGALEMIFYPHDAAPVGETLAARHTDWGYIGVLNSSEPGLMAEGADGKVYSADPVPGTIIVTMGDMAQFFSDGKIRACPHWVVNKEGKDRHTAAFFYEPNLDASIPNSHGETFQQFTKRMEEVYYVKDQASL